MFSALSSASCPPAGSYVTGMLRQNHENFFHAAGNFDGDFAETGIFCVNMMEFL